MKVVKKTEMFTIYVKSSGRFAVKDANKNWINAEEKVKILVENGFIKAFVPPVKKESDVEQEINEAPAAEAPAEEAPEEDTKPKSAPKTKAKTES